LFLNDQISKTLLFSTTSKFLEFKRYPYSIKKEQNRAISSNNEHANGQTTNEYRNAELPFSAKIFHCYIGYLFRILHRATLFLQRLESSDWLANRQSGGCISGGGGCVFGECHCWLNTETHKDKIKNTRE